MKRHPPSVVGLVLAAILIVACGGGAATRGEAASGREAASDHVGHVKEPPAVTSGEENPIYTVTTAPHPSAEDVDHVLVTPSAEELNAGGEEVAITDEVSIGHWTESAELFPTTWEKNSDGLRARYRASFQGEDGELSAFFLGTTKDSPIEPKCFGLCAHWWVAPALADGTQDMENYHVMSDDLWHPLAREWYLSH
jgi:hypothetical protein